MKRVLLLLLLLVPTSALAQPDLALQDAGPPAVAEPAPAPTTPEVAPAPAAPAAEERPSATEPVASTPAEEPGSISDDPVKFAGKVLGWVMDGEYGLAAMGALMLVLILLRAGAGKVDALNWFKTRWGGWALNLGTSTLGAILTGRLAGEPVTTRLVLTGLLIGFAAAGGVEFFKDVKKGNAE
jgi:hypothetical protein